MLNPSSFTDQQLYEYVAKMLAEGYSELEKYSYSMRDHLTVGMSHFGEDLTLLRAWNNRVLGMLQQARQINAPVQRMSQGKRRLYECSVAEWTRNAKVAGELSGLDGSERKALARANCSSNEEDAERWEELKTALRSYIDSLEDKQKDLTTARNDLRAQLWAIRVHGVLGEFSKEARDDEFGEGSVSKSKVSSASTLAIPPPPQTTPVFLSEGGGKPQDVDVDVLLNSKE